jgi:glycosyltransferase involved in cell wall biosynthesis
MAWGLIPITTSQGFNRSVIENDSLIVEKLDVKCFVNKIKYIIDNDLIEQFSYNSYNRVLSNYTDEIVLEKLKEEYDFLFNVKFTS